MAGHAKDILEDAQREQIFLDQRLVDYSQMNKYELEEAQKDISKRIRDARKEFQIVGDNFFKQEKYKQAAKCYFSSLSYEKAAAAYLKVGSLRSAAECYYILEMYDDAAVIFEKIGEFNKAIEC